MPYRAIWLLIPCLACSKSTAAPEDASITFDASRLPDAAQPGEDAGEDDATEPASLLGEACRSDADCDGVCLDDFPGGYCTEDCSGTGECDGDGVCTRFGGGTFLCLLACSDGEDPCARPGYGCAAGRRFNNVCVEGCTEDSDCPEGLLCDPLGGFSGEGSCHDPDGQLGDACTSEEQCPLESTCLGEGFSGFPGGACIGFGCNFDDNTGCPEGAVCIPSQQGEGLCLQSCENSDDCRTAYSCDPSTSYPDRLFCNAACTSSDQCSDGQVCNPALGTCDVPFDPNELGEPCSTSFGACRGGSCLSEFESGYPGSSCIYVGCDPNMNDDSDGCPGDGVCVQRENAEDGFCIAPCGGGCRTGYSCRMVDPDNSARGQGCFPACTSNAQCANDGTDGAPDFSCNPGTGLCRDAFVDSRLGEPCEEAMDCPGGRCLSESAAGYPAGTCAAVGCRLEGTGNTQECPDGGVCVDDERGDPEIGMCLTMCSVATPMCRPGYGCVSVDGMSDQGACRPACEMASCSGSRSCNMMTGQCE